MTTPAGSYQIQSRRSRETLLRRRAMDTAPSTGRRRSHRASIGKTLLIIAGIVVLVVVGVSMAVLRESSPDAMADVLGPKPASLNTAVSDGKLTFVVSDVSPATHWSGNPQPRGQWVVATMAVTNTGNEPQWFFAQNQKLIDTNGREYAADTMAAYAMNQDDAMTIDLNPGLAST